MSSQTIMFPPEAPLVPRPGVPELYRPVVLERHLFPAMAETVALLLGIPVGFIPGSVVGAYWTPGALGPGTWAVARISVHLKSQTWPAFLIQPLASALEWGAIGLRRPPGGREPPQFDRAGSLVLSETNRQDLSAYAEVCNVVACSALARTWEEQLEQSLFVLLEEVVAAAEKTLPEGLRAEGLAAVQALFGYQERPAPPKAGPADYERRTPWLLVLPADQVPGFLWRVSDGSGQQKSEWLLTTGSWRRK
jgi:hypothetical protein